MKCACCDADLAQPIWNRQLEMWEYCPVCLDVIRNVFSDHVEDDRHVEIVPYDDELEYLLELYE